MLLSSREPWSVPLALTQIDGAFMRQFPVVVADDDATLLRLLKAHLSKAGFEVFTCMNGDEALDLVHRHRPAILLADWQMPGKSGLELCRAIRKSTLSDHVYVMLVTGNSQPDQVATGLSMGANDYLVKPVHATVLVARVRAGSRVLQLRAKERTHTQNLEKEVAKRKRAEEELRRANDFTSSIISSMIDMMVVVAPDGAIRIANEALCSVLGYDAEELIGQPVSLLLSGENEDCSQLIESRNVPPFRQPVLRDFVGDGEISNVEGLLRARSGHMIPVHMSSSVMRYNNGEIRGVVLLAQDITDRKRLETQLLESNRGLLAVNEIHQTLFACQTTRAVAITLTDALVDKFDAHFARVWMTRPGDLCSRCSLSEKCRDSNLCLHLVASSGHDAQIDDNHRRVPLGAFNVGLIACGQGKMICNDLANDELVLDREWAVQHGLQSFAGLPLTRDGEVIGVMAMFSKQPLPPHLVDTLDLLAELGSAAVTNVEKTEALRDSEETFRCISTCAQDAVVMLDGDGHISFWNEAAETIFGYSREEAIGKHLRSAGFLVPQRFRDAHYQAWPEFQETGQGAAVGKTVELVALRKNGTEFPVEISLSAVSIKGRWHAVGVLRDISERKRAEVELRKLSVVVEQSPLSIVLTDTHGAIEYVNPMFSKVTGYAPEEVIGRNPHILKSGKLPEESYKALWNAILSGETWTGEFENRKKSGDLYWEIASICPIRDTDGAIKHFLAVKQDITDRKRGEQAARDHALAIESANAALQQANEEADGARLRTEQAKDELESVHRKLVRSHDKMNQLIEAFTSVLIGINENGEVTAWNGQAEQTLGIERNVALGRMFTDLEIEWDQVAVAKGMSECLAHNTPMSLEDLRFKKPDGTDGFLGIRLNPLIDSAGKHGGLLLVAADITEQKILHGQLVQAQKLESIGQLAAGIAHEINTPIQYVGDNVRFLSDAMADLLSLIGSYRDLIFEVAKAEGGENCADKVATLEQDADLPYLEEELPKSIAQSLDGVGRVSKIVRAMKDFSHPGVEGKEAVDLNTAIESTITVARNEWKYVADMVTDFDSNLPSVPCVVGEFNQVILNIVINAAHAISDVVGENSGEKGTITVSTRQDGGWVEVRIGDTGTGIPAEHRAKVFDHFFTTKEVGKGTGQGLSIAHSVITEKHGGTLTLESEMGKGTTFIIRLPIEPDSATTEETAQNEEETCSLH